MNALTDALLEGTEQIRFTLAAAPNEDYQLGAGYRSVVSIQDRLPVVTLSAASLEVQEGSTVSIDLIRDGSSFQPITVDFDLTEGAGIEASDYEIDCERHQRL